MFGSGMLEKLQNTADRMLPPLGTRKYDYMELQLDLLTFQKTKSQVFKNSWKW